MWRACALLATCLAMRCAAECDINIENKIKSEHRDELEFVDVLDNKLYRGYQIRAISSGNKFANKHGNNCLRMNFFKTFIHDHYLTYTDVRTFKVTYNDGALITTDQDKNGVLKVSHRLVYVTQEVIALYVCSDAAGDPSFSVVAVSDQFVSRPSSIEHQVKMATEALERAGVQGFAFVPFCS